LSEDTSKFIKSTFIIVICSLLSKVLGLLKQTLIGSLYGATSSQGLSDCYAASFRLPDIIFNVIVFGTVSIVLIPYFSAFIKKEEFEKLKKSCSEFLNFFLLFIGFFLILGFIFAPYFVREFLVKGWTDENNITLTISMTRILLLQVFFMTLSSIMGSYLNALEKFKAYSFAILSYNVGIIFGIIFLTPFLGIKGVAWGAVIGGFSHFMFQFIGSYLNGFRYSLGLPKPSKDILNLFMIAVPRMIGIGFEQFVKFFIVNIASFLFIGSIFIFENVENFAMMPFSVIAVSVSTTVFPVFSKYFAVGEYDKMMDELLVKLRTMIFLMLPVSLFMIIFNSEIINLLLMYKKFTLNDARLTSEALSYYMLGMPFFSITIVLVKFYYAQKKSFLPMIITLLTVAITVVSCYIFAKSLKVSGLSLGRSIGYIFQSLLLVLFLYINNLKEKTFKRISKKPIIDTIKIVIISFAVFVFGLFLENIIRFNFNQKLDAILKLLIIGMILMIVFLILCLIFKIPETSYILNKLKEKLITR